MSLFTKDEKRRIAEAITEAERNTSGEIVAVVTAKSDDYHYIALLWAALAALAMPLLLILFPQITLPSITGFSAAFLPHHTLYLIQLVTFAVLAGLFQWEPARMAVTPPTVKRARAHRNAVEQFIAQDLHTTESRTGMLIFVSAAEHYAEIIADDGIAKKVDPGVWDEIIADLTGKIGAGRAADGFVSAIDKCGELLTQHFPPGSENSDELPNHLIEL